MHFEHTGVGGVGPTHDLHTTTQDNQYAVESDTKLGHCTFSHIKAAPKVAGFMRSKAVFLPAVVAAPHGDTEMSGRQSHPQRMADK